MWPNMDFSKIGLGDSLNYVLFKNPVSSTVINSVKTVAGYSSSTATQAVVTTPAKLPPALQNLEVWRIVYTGSPFVRLGGLSGAAAVVLGAYGAHSLMNADVSEERKKIFETANRYHFLHTLALFGVPLSRHPKVTGSLLTLGMLVFCGSCYYDAITGNKELRKLTPVGGTCLIFGWLVMVL